MKQDLDIKFQSDFINYFSKNFIKEFSDFYEKHVSLKEEIEIEKELKIEELFFAKFYNKFTEELKNEINFYNSFYAELSRKTYQKYLQSFLINFTTERDLILVRFMILINFQLLKKQSIKEIQKKTYYKTLNSMIQLIEENYNKFLKMKRYRTFNKFLKDNIKEINKIKKIYNSNNFFYITITTDYNCSEYNTICFSYPFLEEDFLFSEYFLFSEESLSILLESLKNLNSNKK